MNDARPLTEAEPCRCVNCEMSAVHPDDGHDHWYACVRCGVDNGINDAARLAAPPPDEREGLDARTAYLFDRARRGYHAAHHGPSQDADDCTFSLCVEMRARLVRDAEQPAREQRLWEAAQKLVDEYDAYRDPEGDESPDGWMDAIEDIRAALTENQP